MTHIYYLENNEQHTAHIPGNNFDVALGFFHFTNPDALVAIIQTDDMIEWGFEDGGLMEDWGA